MTKPKPPSFRELFPDIAEEELEVAEKNLEEYLRIVARIYARIHNDPGILEVLGISESDEDSNSD